VATEGYLLDTNVASWAWDANKPQHKSVREWLTSIPPEFVFISPPTLAEVEYGLRTAPNMDTDRIATVRRAMQNFRVRPISHHTAQAYSIIRAALFEQFSPLDRRGRRKSKYIEDLIESTSGKELGIQENDLWIVAVAVEFDLCLVTGDTGAGMHRILEAAVAFASYWDRTIFWPPH